MQILSKAGLLAAIATLFLSAHSLAASPDIIKPGSDAGDGRTWMDFLGKAVPGLVLEGDKAIAKTAFELSYFDGEVAEINPPVAISTLDPKTLVADGKPLVAIVSNLELEAADEAYALLSVHRADGTLVASVNIASDRMNGWDEANPVIHAGAKNDVLAFRSSHFNSSQGYDVLALAFVDGKEIKLIDSIFLLSDRLCSRERNQKSMVEAVPGKDAGHGAFRVVITDAIVPTGEACDGEEPVEAETRTIAVTYNWDAATGNYVADSDGIKALVALQQDNESRL